MSTRLGSSSCSGARFTEIDSAAPSRRHSASCAQAVRRTHSPIFTMSPVRSATGMKTTGEIDPSVGLSQRTSASKLIGIPLSSATIGWYTTCISPRASAPASAPRRRRCAAATSPVPATAVRTAPARDLPRRIASSAPDSRSAPHRPGIPMARPMVAVTPTPWPSMSITVSDTTARSRPARSITARSSPMSWPTIAKTSPADPAENVLPARPGSQSLADLLEHPIGRQRAVGVVDEAEAVQPDAERGDRAHVGRVDGVEQLVGLRAQQRAVGEPRQGVVQAALGEQPAQFEMGHDRGGQIAEDPDVLVAPLTRRGVDRAERSDRISVGEHERHAGVRDETEIANREAVGDERMLASVGDDQRLLRRHRVLAERVAQRERRTPASSSGRPDWLLMNCRSASTSETSDTGTPSRSVASRV